MLCLRPARRTQLPKKHVFRVSHRWDARCPSGRDNLENRASVRLCGTCWEPLKTAGQPSAAGAAWITSSGPHRPKQTSKLGGALNAV
jgi:hypothetical protein